PPSRAGGGAAATRSSRPRRIALRDYRRLARPLPQGGDEIDRRTLPSDPPGVMKYKEKKSKPAPKTTRGVATLDDAKDWFARQNIEEIECVVPDLAGVARGKIMPVRKFLGTPSMNLPLAVFYQTITGDFPEFEGDVN